MIFDITVRKKFKSEEKNFFLNIKLQSNKRKIVVIGPSGSGKSLFLKSVVGIVNPDCGFIKINQTVFFSDNDHINIPIEKRKIAYLPQDYALFPHLNVKQNILFGLTKQIWNPSKAMVSDQAEYWMDKFKIKHIENSFPKKISGGQQQRVALARALILKPDILLLDEPFSALDHVLRNVMREEINQILNDVKIPMIMITHDHEDIKFFAEDVLEISGGISI